MISPYHGMLFVCSSYLNALLTPRLKRWSLPWDTMLPNIRVSDPSSHQYSRRPHFSFSSVAEYLSSKDVQRAIGVEGFGNFSSISFDVNQAFERTLDRAFPSQYYISALLERGVRALVYVGDTDFMCNWVCNAS